MASESPQPPEGFATHEPDGIDDDDRVPTVELSPGETLNGLVLDVREGKSDNGPWVRLKIKDEERGVCVYFAKGDVKRTYYEDGIEEGEPIWVAKTTEEETFTNDGGEEVTFNPTIVAFPEGE